MKKTFSRKSILSFIIIANVCIVLQLRSDSAILELRKEFYRPRIGTISKGPHPEENRSYGMNESNLIAYYTFRPFKFLESSTENNSDLIPSKFSPSPETSCQFGDGCVEMNRKLKRKNDTDVQYFLLPKFDFEAMQANGITICTWFFPYGNGEIDRSEGGSHIFDIGNEDASHSFFLCRLHNTDTLTFRFVSPTFNKSIDVHHGYTSDKWRHACVSFNHNRTCRLHLDGEIAGEMTIPALTTFKSERSYLGRSRWAADAPFAGKLRVYSPALSPAEINSLYHWRGGEKPSLDPPAQASRPPPGPVTPPADRPAPFIQLCVLTAPRDNASYLDRVLASLSDELRATPGAGLEVIAVDPAAGPDPEAARARYPGVGFGRLAGRVVEGCGSEVAACAERVDGNGSVPCCVRQQTRDVAAGLEQVRARAQPVGRLRRPMMSSLSNDFSSGRDLREGVSRYRSTTKSHAVLDWSSFRCKGC
jgi:hypothetical protein